MSMNEAYEALAYKILARYSDIKLKRIIKEEGFLSELIYEELWELDYTGIFLDVLFLDLSRKRRQSKIEPEMRALADKLASLLDTNKLVDKLLEIT